MMPGAGVMAMLPAVVLKREFGAWCRCVSPAAAAAVVVDKEVISG